MHGFKSFAEPVSIEFNDGITCIVGPNGSGKSNISDAIRWALGEQSPKTLRGGKMEEVIFAGTESRKSRGMAEVTLVIDNSKGILPIDYSEVAITRRMYRSGESEYSINNIQCRLRDIRELIMDTGIGVDGYSIIGQGKIADIVSNKPESRREIFEEAAGIVMYRTRKADSEKKLESAAANLERVNDIIAEIESRIGILKEDSVKAAEYLKLKERYKELEINITLKNIESVELKNEYIVDDIMETDNSIDEAKTDKEGLDRSVNGIHEKVETLDSLSGETSGRLLNSVEVINDLISAGQLSDEKITRYEKDEVRLTEEISSYEDKLAREDANLKTLTDKKRETDQKMRLLSDELARRIEQYTEKTSEFSSTGDEIDGRKNEMYRLHNDVSVKNSEITSLENLKGTLDRRKRQLLSEKQGCELSLQELKENVDRAAIEISDAREALRESGANRERLMAKHNEAILDEKTMTREAEELRVSIGQLSSRKKTIEEMESNYEGYSGAVKFIMRAGLKGIDGVVAELINVPDGYEVAIETALGASLQNIVCENDAAAQAAIAALKENKAGRLTFLPVGSIKPAATGGKAVNAGNGFRGFGVDCISFEPKYRNIMEYLLGRTVVVEKLDDAIKLSKESSGNYRFVTLDGEIISAGGAITGGAYKNRTANLLERKSEIARLSAQIEGFSAEKAKNAARLENLRAYIEETQRNIADIDGEYRSAEVRLMKHENEVAASQNIIADFNNSMEKWGNELVSIESELSGADGMILELRSNVTSSKGKIADTEKELENLLTEYDNLKNDMEVLNEGITKARIAASSCENEKANDDALVLRIQGAMDEMALEKRKREEELAGARAERETLLAGNAGRAAELKSKEEEKASIENYLAELAEEKAGAMRALAESTREKDAFDAKLASLQSQKYELEIKKAKNETQLDNYKDKLWEEFEVSYIQAIEFKKKNFAMNAALKESRDIKNRIKELGEVNVGAIKEYETVGERRSFLTGQRADILEAMGALKQIIGDMDKTIKERFKESFDKITENFTDVFKSLFGGGYAELRLEDEAKPLESGIEIIAQPPGKKLQNINLMSGGEKTMTAIAMMFAILKTKPTPFCILDEIEAALDDSNIDRFSKYLKSFEGIQFTLVTHQKATMEHADVLYGVTMPEQGISKVISLKLGDEFEL